jgi:hypothetical protein
MVIKTDFLFMGKLRYDYSDYIDILQDELDKKNLVAVKIDNNVVVYWKDVTIPFVFFKESEYGNIVLKVQIEPIKKIKYATGCITRFGKIFCESIISNSTLYNYCDQIYLE